MLRIEQIFDSRAWDAAVEHLHGHPLQLWGWGEVKAQHSWRPVRVLLRDGERLVGACQILVRRVGPIEVAAYAPRGPVWVHGYGSRVLTALANWARARLAGLVLLIEPDVEHLPAGTPFERSERSVLLSHTLIVNLERDQDEIFVDMSKTYRKNLRRAERDGAIEIRRLTTHDEVDDALRIYQDTAERDGFPLHSAAYYHEVMDLLGEHSVLYGAYARQDGELLSFLWNVEGGVTAFELYGGMTDRGASMRANFPLKWHAIREARERGVTRYDMNGLLNDGVSRFKQGWVHDHEADDLAGTFELSLSRWYGPAVRTMDLAKAGSVSLARLRREAGEELGELSEAAASWRRRLR